MTQNNHKKHSALDDILGYRLRRSSTIAMSSFNQFLNEFPLRITEASVLMQIARAPNITSSQICAKLGLKRSNLTPIITRLTDLQYVKSKAKDGRSVSLSVTTDGAKACEHFEELSRVHDQRFFASLSQDEQDTLHQLLSRVIDSHT